MKKIDLTGMRFGRLVVLGEVKERKGRDILWQCKCDCGAITVVHRSSLKGGGTQSCGCLQRERTSEAHTTHGASNDPWYDVYYGMMYRCYNPKNRYYSRYGGRGIEVCCEWRNDPKKFGDWLLAHGWNRHLEIDRENNDGDYTPHNCRIVTRRKNVNNRGNTLRLPDGQSLAELCFEVGIKTHDRNSGHQSKQYNRISQMYRKHKIHPELMSALRKDTRKQARLLYQAAMLRQEFEARVDELKEKVAKLKGNYQTSKFQS